VIDVLIIGAGPVGVLLSAELARHGVAASVVDSRPDSSTGTRAVGVHAATLSALEGSGATDRLLDVARLVRTGVASAGGRRLGVVRFDRLASRHPYVATLPQHATEAALAATAAQWGAAPARRGATALHVRAHREAVEVEFGTPGGRADDGLGPPQRSHRESARIVVIAGGSRARALSPLTAAARIRPYPDRYLMTDAPDTSDDGDAAVVRLEPDGVLESFPLPGNMRRYVAWVPSGGVEHGPSAADRLAHAVARRMRDDAGAAAISDASAFGVRRVLVPTMREGRVFAIGDAAHEVSPIGGQGMNLGLLDAVALAPLLARWVRTGAAPEQELAAWEGRRMRSAARAARIAALNTVLGRPLSHARDALRRVGVAGALSGRSGTLVAHVYTMGMDGDAA
jgi:2-polyprenyl-6-methoxyphenol hydroxylase-like FAD-dependent oxidoreductase